MVQVDGRRPDVKVNAQVSLNVDVGAMEHVVPSARVTVSPVVDVHVVRLPREVSVVVEDQGAAVVVRVRPVGVVRRGNVETGRHTTVSVKVDVVHRGVPGASSLVLLRVQAEGGFPAPVDRSGLCGRDESEAAEAEQCSGDSVPDLHSEPFSC